MTIEEAITQLADLRKDRESFAKNDESDGVFAHDIKAIDIAVKALEENDTLKTEIMAVKSGSDVMKIRKLEEENNKLKRLLRLAVEDMKNVSDDNCCYHCIYGNPITRHCKEYKGNRNCYKWQHADEAMKLIGGDK